MKIKYADKRNDEVIIKNEFKMEKINTENFKGTISLINIKEVTNHVSVTRPNNTKECVEYKWLGIYPKNAKYCITVMYDNNWNLLQWYFDIVKDTCEDELGVPYIYDLYLDIVVLPNGEHYILDEDELEQALFENEINKEEYKMAYTIAGEVSKRLDCDFDKLENFTEYCLKVLKDKKVNF